MYKMYKMEVMIAIIIKKIIFFKATKIKNLLKYLVFITEKRCFDNKKKKQFFLRIILKLQ